MPSLSVPEPARACAFVHDPEVRDRCLYGWWLSGGAEAVVPGRRFTTERARDTELGVVVDPDEEVPLLGTSGFQLLRVVFFFCERADDQPERFVASADCSTAPKRGDH